MLKNVIITLALIALLTSSCQNNLGQKDQGISKERTNMLSEVRNFPTSGINDSINTQISFAENTRNKDKLVLKYSRTNCWECVEDCIRVLKKFSDSTGFYRNNIIIISSDYTHRDFRLFHSNNLKDIAVYNLGEDIGLSIEKENYPYLFILEGGKTMKDIFLPVKYDDEETINYLMKTLPKYTFKN